MERGLSARSLALGRVDGAWVEFATGFASATGGQAKARGELHPLVDARRAEPHRHVRPEAPSPLGNSRRVAAHPDQHARHAYQRVDAKHGQVRRQVFHHSLDAFLLGLAWSGRSSPDER